MVANRNAEPGGWTKIAEPWATVLCDLCMKWARWAHPAGGLRCAKCPRPNR